jgi:hypothetical protein
MKQPYLPNVSTLTLQDAGVKFSPKTVQNLNVVIKISSRIFHYDSRQ